MANSQPLKIQIIIGTTRQNRFSEKAAAYIYQEAKKEFGLEVELVDLRDYPLPFFDEPVTPSMNAAMNKEYENEQVKKWTKKVSEADGYIIVSAEYNHGYPAVLKNALDYVYKPWNKKAVGFVSYGNLGGARAVEQLRQVVIELQMAPIKNSVHITPDVIMAIRGDKGPLNLDHFNSLREGRIDRIEAFLSELIWTTRALKNARETGV